MDIPKGRVIGCQYIQNSTSVARFLFVAAILDVTVAAWLLQKGSSSADGK